MRIGAISSNNSKSTKVQSGKNNNVNFKSAYADIYKWAEKENLPNLAALHRVIDVLWEGALKIKGMKTADIGIAKDMKKRGLDAFLSALRNTYWLNLENKKPVIYNPSNGNIAVSACGRDLIFDNPQEFQLPISIGLKRDFWDKRYTAVEILRRRGFDAYYYESGRLKEHFDVIEDGGGMINHCYYNEDGTKSFWKNKFL